MTDRARAFWVRVACALVAALVLTPVVALIVPEARIHRIMTRTFLITAIVAFAMGVRPADWRARLQAMGLRGPDRFRRFALGAGVSIVLLVGLLLVQWAAGGRAPASDAELGVVAHLLLACLSGVIVGFLEEVLFRGYMKDAIGGTLSALLYAGVHFLRPLHGSAPPPDGFDPLLGFKHLPIMVEQFTHPRFATLGILSLFLFGVALNRMRERSGTLYLGIGVHAGLVFALSFYRRVLDPATTGNAWVHGGGRLHDGVLGTIMLALLLLAAHRAPLPRMLRPERQ